MYLSDDLNYTTVPPKWSEVSFATVDLLLIAPLGIQDDGKSNLYKSPKTGPLTHRFSWVLQKARSEDPGIKIFASQFGVAPLSTGAPTSPHSRTLKRSRNMRLLRRHS